MLKDTLIKKEERHVNATRIKYLKIKKKRKSKNSCRKEKKKKKNHAMRFPSRDPMRHKYFHG